jgi:hypothetical protein
MRTTSKHLQINGRSAELIFIFAKATNIVSLFKRFGRLCLKSAQVLAANRYRQP